MSEIIAGMAGWFFVAIVVMAAVDLIVEHFRQ